MEKKGNHTAAKASTASILSVAMVLFASHAGGGFATGNQENTYFVCSGWAGLLSLALSMAILTGIIAIAMRLYNKYDLHSYKELFEKLYHPFDKLELVFELFFYVMVIMAVSVAIAGAASALGQYFGWNYYVCIVLVGLCDDFWRTGRSINQYLYGNRNHDLHFRCIRLRDLEGRKRRSSFLGAFPK